MVKNFEANRTFSIINKKFQDLNTSIPNVIIELSQKIYIYILRTKHYNKKILQLTFLNDEIDN